MTNIYVGTAYHQIFCVPLNMKEPILKLGEKKKSPVVSIYLPDDSPHVYYADTQQAIGIDTEQNQSFFSQYIPKAQTDNKKIIFYEQGIGQRLYFTNHGEIFFKDIGKQNEQQKLQKLYYNQTYQNILKSLPPQRAGKLMPEYTRAMISQSGDNIVAGFVGRGVLPFVYSFQKSSIIWKAKNVTNDELDLQIPPNDVDLCFLNNNIHMVAANAQNKIRIYDVNSRRRKPVSDITLTQVIKADKVNLTKITKSPCQKYLYVGNHKGSVYELDARKNYMISHKFKGINTTIKDIKVSGDHLAVISLDGYLRIFNLITKEKQFQRYLNTHPQILKIGKQQIQFSEEEPYKVQEINLNQENVEQKQAQQSKVRKVKKIRKRNKVGLKYLQPRPFDSDVKVQHKHEHGGEESSEMKEEKNIAQDYDEDLDL